MRRLLRIAALMLWLPVLSSCHFIELVSFFEAADTVPARKWELHGGVGFPLRSSTEIKQPIAQTAIRYGLLPGWEVEFRVAGLLSEGLRGHAVLGELKWALLNKPYGIIPAIGLKASVGRLKPPGTGWETVFGGSLHLSYPSGPYTFYLAGRRMQSQISGESGLHGAVGLRFDLNTSQRWWIELSATTGLLGPSAELLGVAWSLRF